MCSVPHPPHYSSPKLVHSFSPTSSPHISTRTNAVLFFFAQSRSRSPQVRLEGEGGRASAFMLRSLRHQLIVLALHLSPVEDHPIQKVLLASFQLRWHSMVFFYSEFSFPPSPPTCLRRDISMSPRGGRSEGENKERTKKLTWSNITLIVRLQLGHTATSSPSRMSLRHISNWSPQGQGYVYSRSSGWKVRSSNSTSS